MEQDQQEKKNLRSPDQDQEKFEKLGLDTGQQIFEILGPFRRFLDPYLEARSHDLLAWFFLRGRPYILLVPHYIFNKKIETNAPAW